MNSKFQSLGLKFEAPAIKALDLPPIYAPQQLATTRPSYVGAKPGLLSFTFDVPTFTKQNAPLAVPQSTRGGFHS